MLFKLTVIIFGLSPHFSSIHAAGSAGQQETLSVTLLMKSGRRDPSWKIQSSDPKFEEVKRLLNQASCGGLAKTRKDIRSRLGYKGLLVQQPEVLIDGDQTLDLQKLLLGTIPSDNKPLQANKQQALEEITKMEEKKKESDVQTYNERAQWNAVLS